MVIQKKYQRNLLIINVILALTSLLMIEKSVAKIIVQMFPCLGYLQFPGRFLGIFNLFACASLSTCLARDVPFPEGMRNFIKISIPLLSFLVYPHTIPPQVLNEENLKTNSCQGIRQSITTLDHENKYMPCGSKLPTTPAPIDLLELQDPSSKVWLLWQGLNNYIFNVESLSDGTAKFHQYWFDGWKAELDGSECLIKSDQDLGICEISVPSGTHKVRVWFSDTKARAMAKIISLSAFVYILILCFTSVLRYCNMLYAMDKIFLTRRFSED